MKKILIVLLSLLFVSVSYAQRTGVFPYTTMQQSYIGDTVKRTLEDDTVKFTTSELAYDFDKPLFVNGQEIGEGSGDLQSVLDNGSEALVFKDVAIATSDEIRITGDTILFSRYNIPFGGVRFDGNLEYTGGVIKSEYEGNELPTADWVLSQSGGESGIYYLDTSFSGNSGKYYNSPEQLYSDIDDGTIHVSYDIDGAYFSGLSQISAISNDDANNVKVGDYVGGSDVFEYNTVVVDIIYTGVDNNTLLISKPSKTTGSGVGIEMFSPINVTLTGGVNVPEGGMYRQGVYLENKGKIIGDNDTVLNVGTEIPTIPYRCNLGNVSLTGDNSVVYYESTTGSGNDFYHICSIEFGNITSEGLDNSFYIDRYSRSYANYFIKGVDLNTYGKIGNFENIDVFNVDIKNASGLIYGIYINKVDDCQIDGKIETPTSITVISGTSQASFNVNAIVVGKLLANGCNFNSTVYGSQSPYYCTFNELVLTGSLTIQGDCSINKLYGNGNNVYCQSTGNVVIDWLDDATIRPSTSTTRVVINGTSTNSNNKAIFPLGKLTLNGSNYFGTGLACTGSGVIINNGILDVSSGITISGTFVNTGYIYGKITQTGGMSYLGTIIGTSFSGSTINDELLTISGGTATVNGIIDGKTTTNTIAIIEKSGGLVNINGGDLLTNNSMPPFKITSNTDEARNIRTYSGYCNDTIYKAFDGGAYAPVDSVGGMLENAKGYANINANYTLSEYNHKGNINADGAITITLPDAELFPYEFTIKKMDSGTTTTIETMNSQTIDGQTSAILNIQYTAVKIYSDGSNWLIGN